MNRLYVRVKYMFRKGSLSLYGSVALLLGAFIIFVLIGSGIKTLLIMIVVVGALYLLGKLPDNLAKVILSTIFVIVFSILVQSWLFTLVFTIVAILDVVTSFYHEESRLSMITNVSFIVVLMIGGIWSSTYTPSIEQQVLLEVEEEMKKKDEVYNATLDFYNNTVRCSVVVAESMAYSERQHIGELCAKRVSDNVNPKRDIVGKTDELIGYLYDYYSIFIDVFTKEEYQLFQAKKHPDEANVTWNEIEDYRKGTY